MNVINSVAQFERDLLIERAQAGMARARAQGKRPVRPAALTPGQRQDARNRIENGETISAIAREMKTSRQTIMRVRDQGCSRGISCTFVRITPLYWRSRRKLPRGRPSWPGTGARFPSGALGAGGAWLLPIPWPGTSTRDATSMMAGCLSKLNAPRGAPHRRFASLRPEHWNKASTTTPSRTGRAVMGTGGGNFCSGGRAPHPRTRLSS